MSEPIGIDLGTTNSLVAVLRETGPEVLRNELGSALTPSVVALDDSGHLLVGEPARERLRRGCTDAVARFKPPPRHGAQPTRRRARTVVGRAVGTGSSGAQGTRVGSPRPGASSGGDLGPRLVPRAPASRHGRGGRARRPRCAAARQRTHRGGTRVRAAGWRRTPDAGDRRPRWGNVRFDPARGCSTGWPTCGRVSATSTSGGEDFTDAIVQWALQEASVAELSTGGRAQLRARAEAAKCRLSNEASVSIEVPGGAS